MDIDNIRAAASMLNKLWSEGRRVVELPVALRPETRDQGYEIQAHVESMSRLPLFGWKIAATSLAGQKHIGVDGPLAGRLLVERVFSDGQEIPFGANSMKVAEAEFAFRIAAELPPRDAIYQQSEVLAAVSDLHLAIEIPDSRFIDFSAVGAPQLIADNACAHQFVLGRGVASWRHIDLASHPVVATWGRGLTRTGAGSNVLGDPRKALTWLVNELSALGISLLPGEIVTTGTCLTPMEVARGDQIEVDYGELGTISCLLV
ncbi:hydratase [Agrobacterium tumefaciens]|uniref:2-keto-4-pentenoate hydratase n=1 Tax=Agrobacterium tumefaciens TaxID=358 RepID=UPI0015736045|nr:fumarylacetoacetate hydrolase family protein [Agrobacterium tumefaciens]NTB97345.1 hydratase [Agrobacterium tumefaciens]NTC45093.1 hydratase [Agrobacterium tumefaciens]